MSNEFRVNFMNYQYVVILISILALSLSIWNFYYTQLRKFKLKVYDAGRYDISVNFFNSYQLALYPILIFSNMGIKTGIIENILLKLWTQDKSYIFVPHATVLSRKIYFMQEADDFPPTPEMESFCSFSLASKEVIAKKLMFVPHQSYLLEIPAGTHTVEIYIKTSTDAKLELMHKYAIQINQEDLASIRDGFPSGAMGKIKINVQDKRTPALEIQYQKLTDENITYPDYTGITQEGQGPF